MILQHRGQEKGMRSFVFITATIFLLTTGTFLTKAEEFGEFSGAPVVQLGGDGRTVTLMEDLSFTDPHDRVWLVKKGTIVDGASIPRQFWSVIGGPFEGQYRDASIVHDHFCQRRAHDADLVHNTFYLGMRARGVGESKAWVMYKAVSWFGPRWKTVTKVPDSCKPGATFDPSACVINSVTEVKDVEQPLTQERFDRFLGELRAEGLETEATELHAQIKVP